MKKLFYIYLYLLILSTAIHAQEFAYVTDSLQLRVYSSASADSELLQTIESGESVETFATEGGFTQVTTYDGTVGWVKSAFLVEDPPEKLLYFSVSEKNKELVAELERLKSEGQSSNTVSSDQTSSEEVETLQAELSSLQESNRKLLQQLENKNVSQTESSAVFTNNVSNTQGLFEKLKKWWLVVLALLLLVGLSLDLNFLLGE